MKNDNTTTNDNSEDGLTLSKKQLRSLVKLAKYALGVTFVMFSLMLFHVLIDFFYHT